MDLETLSRLVERRLTETDRKDQAAAFVRLGLLRALVDAIANFTEPRRGVPLAEIGRLLSSRDLSPESGPEDMPAFLMHLDSDRQALVFDFDALVNQIGELSVALQGLVTADSAPRTEIQRRLVTLWIDESQDGLPAHERISLKGSLDGLKPVGQLTAPYQTADFSKTSLHPKGFLR